MRRKKKKMSYDIGAKHLESGTAQQRQYRSSTIVSLLDVPNINVIECRLQQKKIETPMFLRCVRVYVEQGNDS